LLRQNVATGVRKTVNHDMIDVVVSGLLLDVLVWPRDESGPVQRVEITYRSLEMFETQVRVLLSRFVRRERVRVERVNTRCKPFEDSALAGGWCKGHISHPDVRAGSM